MRVKKKQISEGRTVFTNLYGMEILRDWGLKLKNLVWGVQIFSGLHNVHYYIQGYFKFEKRVKNSNDPVPTNQISVLSVVIFRSKNIKQGNIFNLIYLYAWLIIQMRHHQQMSKWNAKKMTSKGFNMREVWNLYVTTVTKLLSSYYGAQLLESPCKESQISDANWLKYVSSSYLIQIWLSYDIITWHILKL